MALGPDRWHEGLPSRLDGILITHRVRDRIPDAG
jgi:hypothetical protein